MKLTARENFHIISIIAPIFFLFSCSFKPSPKKVVEDHIAEKNSRQVSAIMDNFAENYTFQIPKMGIEMSDMDQIRAIAEYDSALHTTLTLSNISVNGDTVFCSITEHNNWVAAAEIPDVYYPEVMFVVDNEKISHVYAEIADSSMENFRQVLDQFVLWGNDKYPDKMKKMAPEGNFLYTAENGAMVVEMLREWKAEQKQGQQEPVTGMMPKRLDKGK
jgi:hypothetical protein